MTLFPTRTPWKRPEFERWADISECGRYRYALTRRWGPGPLLAVLGINPSTADANVDDNTIKRVCSFAEADGWNGFVMLNPFAFRAKDVRELRTVDDPFGPDNLSTVLIWARRAPRVVIAWGPPTKVPRHLRSQLDTVLYLLRERGIPLYVLRLTAEGHPEHPLMLPADCRPTLWREA